MKFIIDKIIFEKYPDIKVGVIIINNLNNTRRNSSIESLLRGVCAQRERSFFDKPVEAETFYKAWSDAFSEFNVNPEITAPLLNHNIKKVIKGEYLTHINPLTDFINYFSLKYLLPVHGKDLDWLCDDLRLTVTNGGEPFRPSDSINVDFAGENEVGYLDGGGIISRYWNHKECERTKITDKTVSAAIFIEDLLKLKNEEFETILNEMCEALKKYMGGDVIPAILSEDGATIDFGVSGRKNADDSKITAQEKAYFVIKKQQLRDEIEKKELLPGEEDNLPLPVPAKPKSIEAPPLTVFDDHSLKSRVQAIMETALIKAFSQPVSINIEITYPDSPDHGDYSSNLALKLAKQINSSPMNIADKLVSCIEKTPLIEKVDIVKPGFINFFITKNTLEEELNSVLSEHSIVPYKPGEGKTIVLDYSSPNIAKPLGVHHLISTVLGQAICNIFKVLGYKTVSINHLGDWGTQFGKLICAYKKWGDKDKIERSAMKELLALYVKFHDEAEKDPNLEEEARKEFKIFEEGDAENRKLWRWFVDMSMQNLERIYGKLKGISFDFNHGESFYEDKLDEILTEGKQRNIFVEGDKGAYIVEYDDPEIPPFVVQKQDSATLYSTRDFATMKYRINEFRPFKIFYIVDQAQTLHFKQLFKASERFPWYHGEGFHISFGRMRFKDGNMSTRKGNIILLEEVLEESVKKARGIIEEKNPDHSDKEQVSEILGISAVKYNILAQNRNSEIVFDWDKMLSFESNSAPYLQYTYARSKSLLKKASEEYLEPEQKPDADQLIRFEEKTMNILRKIPKFYESLIGSASECKPNLLSNYLYSLAKDFNSFYNDVPVLKAETEEKKMERLKIVEAVGSLLKKGLSVLGLEVVEEM